MAYNHGVRVAENPTSLMAPIEGTAGLQVIIGVAPVNLAADPYHATNRPMLAYSFAEASAAVGYCDNFKDYNICESIDASFRVLNVAPIVLINVLDPKTHKKELEEAYESLQLAMESVNAGMPEDFYSIDLMNAYAALGRVTGEEAGEDLNEEIFSKFCMGK